MSDMPNPVLTNHRQQRRIAIFVSLAALALSLMPTNSRALFVVRDPGETAFGAQLLVSPVKDLGRFVVRFVEPFIPGALLGPGRARGYQLVPADPFVPGPEIDPGPLLVASNSLPNLLSLGDPEAFMPAPPLRPNSDSTSPVGLLNDTIVPGVPEPASWLTMIMGFGIVGAAIRRRAGRKSPGRGGQPEHALIDAPFARRDVSQIGATAPGSRPLAIVVHRAR